MEIDNALTAEVEERVKKLGFDLIDLRKKGSARRVILEVRVDLVEFVDLVDSESGDGITMDHCTEISRALEEWLDSDGSLGENYVLEVSSPGVERPVRWPRHWLRHVGAEVKVKVPGRGRVKALIVSVYEDRVVLRITLNKKGETEDFELKISDSLDARLAWDWD
jgi:ribosome maturation factor RimP